MNQFNKDIRKYTIILLFCAYHERVSRMLCKKETSPAWIGNSKTSNQACRDSP